MEVGLSLEQWWDMHLQCSGGRETLVWMIGSRQPEGTASVNKAKHDKMTLKHSKADFIQACLDGYRDHGNEILQERREISLDFEYRVDR